jgi:hypothetical protein
MAVICGGIAMPAYVIWLAGDTALHEIGALLLGIGALLLKLGALLVKLGAATPERVLAC